MLRNYFKIAVRNLLNSKFYSLINLFGLSIGIACCLLILIYINDELTYDKFNGKSDRIYRLNEFIETEGSGERSSSVPFPVGPTLQDEYSTLISNYVRLFNFQAPTLALANLENCKEFNEPRIFFVDSTFLDVFDFQVLEGNPETILDEPNSIVLTESMAAKYFDTGDVVGKMLRFQGFQNLMVSGIIADSPTNSHFQFDFLISFPSLYPHFGGGYPQTWYWNPCWTYVVLNEGVVADDLEAKFPEFVKKFFHPAIVDDARMALQPLTSIHLTSDLEFEIEANSSMDNIYVFSVIAVLVLLIAGINFMNLSTARSVKRAKEVGMRKTFGSTRSQLVSQFLLESLILTFFSVLGALLIVIFSLPSFNLLADKSIAAVALLEPNILFGLVSILLIIGIGSGIYPAFILSSFKPAKVLKSAEIKVSGLTLRKVLVIVQFTISIFLITGTVIAIQQLNFLREDDIGFNTEEVIFVPVSRSSVANQFVALKNELLRHNNILNVTAVEEILGAKHQGANYQFEGMADSKLFSRLNIRHDFIETFDMEIVEGRSYSIDHPTDDSLALVVNEALIRQMGWTNEEGVGKRYSFGRFNGEIVGIVKDFNFESKHIGIRPLVLSLNTRPQAFNLFIKYMAIRVSSGNLGETIGFVESNWEKMVPERPFEYFFLDDEIDKLYKAEEKLGNVAGIFSSLTIVVACLGLFGLASFMAERRKKEIGIRKVLGGTTAQIVMLLSGGFSRLVLVAIVLAFPLSWLGINVWLQNFAYHIDPNWFVFVWVGLGTLILALGTVSFLSVHSAGLNPVKSLKYE